MTVKRQINIFLILAAIFGNTNGQQYSECNPTSLHDVVIVGAGVSGLSAAVELYNNKGMRNIAILDARDRIGGRIYTVRYDGSKYEDLGAQWIHGGSGHPFVEYIKYNNLMVPESQKPDYQAVFYRMNGSRIPSVAANPSAAAWEAIEEDSNRNGLSGSSYGDAVRRKFDDWLRSNPDSAEDKRAIFNWFYNFQTGEFGEDLTKVSTRAITEYEDLPGAQDNLVKNGWLTALESMTANLPLTTFFRPNSVVRRIKYSGVSCTPNDPNKVAIFLSDGRVFVGKTAIVTIPLGVMKAGTVEFQPSLPQNKLDSINRIGNGCMVKLFLYFNNAWWGTRITNVNVVFMDSVADGIFGQYRNPAMSQWYRGMVGFNTMAGNDRVLQAWLNGDYARFIERLPMSEVSRVVIHILKRAFGMSFVISEPQAIKRTGWCNDPYSMGVYSYASLTSTASDFATLAQPLPSSYPVLFFAGEATNNKQWATVHGAWSTGIRAAGEVTSTLQG